MDPATLIDTATPEPLLVVGSLPPRGRDLDLLVPATAANTLAELLAANGFHTHADTWVRFRDCTAQVVELIPASDFSLGPNQIDQLFAEAHPIAGLKSLMQPASHHWLLITARRVAEEAKLSDKRRAFVTSIDESGAWQRAAEIAPLWGAQQALEDLEHALEGRQPSSWRLRAVTARARRYHRGKLITVSGLDGSGKSTQAEGLEQALSMLGYPVVRVWTSLTAHPLLARIAAPARLVVGGQQEREDEDNQRPPAGEDQDRLTRLRESRPLLQLAWVTFVAIMNAWWQARAVRPHLLRGRIVICDRYTLDSAVHLRYRYGAQHRYRVQLALIRLLSPTPERGYLLDVSAETAYARNQEYTLEQTEQRARLYSEEHRALSVERLDGSRPRQDLCEQLALEVWRALRTE